MSAQTDGYATGVPLRLAIPPSPPPQVWMAYVLRVWGFQKS
jgi:hypothetical protein